MKRALLLVALAVTPAAAAPAKISYRTFAKLYARLMKKDDAKKLEDALPGLSKNLAAAAETSEQWWTDCTVFDELAKADILPEKVMKGLGIRRTDTGGVVHAPAGQMHTYGYLFSQLKTAFGLKGKRWIESRLDERLGLAAGSFGPLAKDGEFSANLTSALFQTIGVQVKVPRASAATTTARAIGHVEQRVTWKSPKGELIKASVFTHLVPLAPLKGFVTTDQYLLVYESLQGERHRLTTAFPIGAGFADGIMKTAADKEPAFKPRYNLFVDPSWTVVSPENLGWTAAK